MRRVNRGGLKPQGWLAVALIAALAVPSTRPVLVAATANALGLSTSTATAQSDTVEPPTGKRQPGLVAPVAGSCRPLTARQIGHLTRYWPTSQRVTAVAVAYGESGGRPCAVGDVYLQTRTWGPSVCLWQLRSMWAAAGTGGPRDQRANLRSADTCARNAAALWRSGGWRHWSAWKNGTYRQHLLKARAAFR